MGSPSSGAKPGRQADTTSFALSLRKPVEDAIAPRAAPRGSTARSSIGPADLSFSPSRAHSPGRWRQPVPIGFASASAPDRCVRRVSQESAPAGSCAHMSSSRRRPPAGVLLPRPGASGGRWASTRESSWPCTARRHRPAGSLLDPQLVASQAPLRPRQCRPRTTMTCRRRGRSSEPPFASSASRSSRPSRSSSRPGPTLCVPPCSSPTAVSPPLLRLYPSVAPLLQARIRYQNVELEPPVDCPGCPPAEISRAHPTLLTPLTSMIVSYWVRAVPIAISSIM